MSTLRSTLVALTLITTAGLAAAQAFPSRPIKLVVPYGPGGSVDVFARQFAQELAPVLGQNVVIENKGGASTGIGAAVVVSSPADGYTVLVGTASTMSTNPVLFSRLPYQPSQLEPVALLGKMPLIVVGSPKLPETLAGLLAYSKANPGKLNYGTLGPGSLGHVIGQKFKATTGIDVTPVPYKGHAQAILDIKGEQLEMLFDGLSSALPHVEAGSLRAFGLIAEKRHPAAPQVPTMGELGYPTLTTAFWIGLFTPVGVPPDVLTALNAATRKVLAMPSMQSRLQQAGIEPAQLTVAEFKQMVALDQEEWRQSVGPLKLKLD